MFILLKISPLSPGKNSLGGGGFALAGPPPLREIFKKQLPSLGLDDFEIQAQSTRRKAVAN